ncbi:MAG: penicillin-binding protein 1B [Gammaproteobacteria bacterium]|nr:penicillin-binding protein 1B [Gammaproteobacteria bacterium]
MAWGAKLALGLVVFATGYFAWLDLNVQHRFEGKRFALPARIYARPLNLYEGMNLTAAELELELKSAGYHHVPTLKRAGSFERKQGAYRIATRAFGFWDGEEPARTLSLRIKNARVTSLRDGESATALARLDPALIGRVYPGHNEDRILLRTEQLPTYLTDAVIAVEDRGFYEHYGVSPRSILRAIWVNLRAGDAVQGGSTITQQLAKNLFLSHDRTLRRKLSEALISVILEARYSKDEILEMYLNEVYLGQEGRRSIHGFGLAARFYFGRRADELSVAESALLVGMVKGASAYNPRRQPERALRRRNLVLDVMAERGVIEPAVASGAKDAPLGVLKSKPKGASPHPAFVDLVRRQLAKDYREADLRTEGLRIFTTLNPTEQHAAETSLRTRLAGLEKAKKLKSLEGAVVVVDPRNGEVSALVGGRQPSDAGFNRALNALRPIGSLVKPAVYLAALEGGKYTLVTPIEDRPITVNGAKGEPWTPTNYDGEYEGQVPLVRALAESKNLAAVHLGLTVGLPKVRSALQRLGVERAIPKYPSILLGSLALTPLEVAQMYQTIANQGFRVPLRAIREVTDASSQPLQRYGLDLVQSVPPEPTFVLVNAMQAVMTQGTGKSARRALGDKLVVAGKTGTTGQLRDSWFAGFGANRLAVVWVGRDDNAPAGLSGASGALRVWADFVSAVNVESIPAEAPAGVDWHWADPERFSLLGDGCANLVRLPFLATGKPDVIHCRSSEQVSPRWRWRPIEPNDELPDSPG